MASRVVRFPSSDERTGVREMTSHFKRMPLQVTPTHTCECPRCAGLLAEQRLHICVSTAVAAIATATNSCVGTAATVLTESLLLGQS